MTTVLPRYFRPSMAYWPLHALALFAVATVFAGAQVNRAVDPASQHRTGPPVLTGPGRPNPTASKVAIVTSYIDKNCPSQKLCQKAFAVAIADAKSYLAANPSANYTIAIPPGNYDLSSETTTLAGQKAVIDLSNIHPANGTFTLKGAGSGQTTLTTANETTQFFGRNVSNITIQGLTLKRKSMTTTQGTFVSAKPGMVTLRISPGFPLITAIYNPQSGNGNWLRSYDNTNPLDPHIDVDPSNTQIYYGRPNPPTCEGRLCTIYLDPPNAVVPAIYSRPHEVVGVKSFKGGEAYGFDDRGQPEGSNVGFRDVVWYDEGRGAFLSIRQVFLLNCSIRRRPPVEGQAQAMSTPGGGPQIVYNKDRPEMDSGNRVDHFTAEATGDDSLAIFNDMSTSAVFSNTVISDSFARTINLFRSCHVKLENNIGKFCSPQFDFPKQYKGCITDTSHPGPSPLRTRSLAIPR